MFVFSSQTPRCLSTCMLRLLPVSLILLLAACSAPAPLESRVRIIDNDPTLSFVSLVSADGIALASAVGNLNRNGCCLRLPGRWRQDLTVALAWKRCRPQHDPETQLIVRTLCEEHYRDVPVPEYPALEFQFYVHLLPDNDAMLVASHLPPDDPSYPGPPLREKDYYADLEAYEARLRERGNQQREWEQAVRLKRAEHDGRGEDAASARRWQPW
ncbi:DUF3304 domain-containing protein [Pseudoxanthomonas wuyuanensis]|nr:DUF3304 domain-containing protein [Pseudoxanthomonas wuyuanensis]